MPTYYYGHHNNGTSNVPSGTTPTGGTSGMPTRYEFTKAECMDANFWLTYLENDQNAFNDVLALAQKSGQGDKYGMCAGIGGCGAGAGHTIWVDLGNMYARLKWRPKVSTSGGNTTIDCRQATLQVDYYDKNKKPITPEKATLKKIESQWIWIAVAVVLFIIIIKKLK